MSSAMRRDTQSGLHGAGLALVVFWAGCATSPQGPSLSIRERAHLAMARGDHTEALRHLETLLKEHPDDLDSTRTWVEAQVKNGTPALALARFEQQDTAVAHYARALVLFSQAKHASGPAIDAFRKAVERSPQEPELNYRLGIALLESEQYPEAAAALAQSLSLAPTKTNWHLPYAKALARLGRAKEAISSLRVVVTSDCTSQEAALAQSLMNEIADPFAGFPKAARSKLDQALGWLQVADVPQQAMNDLEDILKEYPDIGILHALLGLAAARVDDAGRAVEELKRAIELSPDDGKPYLYLADLYTQRQRGEQANDLYEKALERNPCLADAWFKLGDFALERQQLERARVAFRTASRLTPEGWFPRAKLALVYQLEHNWPAADKELRTELEQRPENLEATLRLGLLHTDRYLKSKTASDKRAAQGEATRYLERVLEQQPDNALASRALERIKQP